MQLLFPFDKSEELDDAPHRKSHTVSVLSVGDIKRCSTALYFASKEREVHPVRCDEKGGIIDAADERIEPFELLLRKRGSPESNRVIRLRPWTFYWYTLCPAFVDILDQMIEMFGPVRSQSFCRRND